MDAPEGALPRRGKKRRAGLECTGTALKIYGWAGLLCYSASAAVFQNGLFAGTAPGSEARAALVTGSDRLITLAAVESLLQALGVLGVPVFAFLLVEGFLHTSDQKRYLIRLFAAAVLSEVPYDLAINGAVWDGSGQNALFSVAIALAMLWGLRRFDGQAGALPMIDRALVVLLALFWSRLISSAFGLCTVLLAAAFYLLRGRQAERFLLAGLISVIYLPAPVSCLLLWCYNGQRGKGRKEAFYLLYPLHFLVLWGAGRLIRPGG